MNFFDYNSGVNVWIRDHQTQLYVATAVFGVLQLSTIIISAIHLRGKTKTSK